MSVRTRFAPSPTGYLHVGGLRTALYCYLFARKHGGQFLLRIEDTDQERLVDGATENLIESLKWAGLEIDEGPNVGGDCGPYVQSERLDIYRKYAEQILETEHAYRCFCSKNDLDAMRENQKKFSLPPKYDGRCRKLSSKEIEDNLAAQKPFVIRQAIPAARTVEFEDVVRGRVKFESKDLEDQVLMKTDGFPTYHFANVIDDHLMKITHVVRGEEWVPSTPKHVLLYEAFGWEAPTFVHLPLILNADKTKLSKRQNDVSTESYKQKGYLKEALVNFIALLGWNPGDNREIFSLEELVDAFEMDRLQKSGAVFDVDKLNWFNWQWRRRQYFEELAKVAREIEPNVEIKEPKPNHYQYNFSNEQSAQQFTVRRGEYLLSEAASYLSDHVKEGFDQPFIVRTLLTVEEKFLQEADSLMEQVGFYFSNDLNYEVEQFSGEKEKMEQALSGSLEQLKREDFATEESLRAAWKEVIKNLGLGVKDVMLPCRYALTAEQYSPGAIEVGWALGYDQAVIRLERALQFVKGYL